MSEPFIIMSAPNGARRQKSDHANIPLTPKELAKCAEEIIEAGASIIHLHVRDEDGAHSLNVDRYRAAIAAIRDAVGDKIIIQATSEAVGRYSRQEQMAMVRELKPEAISLALRELCPGENEVSEIADFAKWMARENIFPQYILYDETDYQRFDDYRRRGIFDNNLPFTLFVLGSYRNDTPEKDVDQLKRRTRQADFPWAVCGFGINEADAVIHAARHGGHIRVGFENNIWRKEGEPLLNNAEMIKFCADTAAAESRPVATVDDIKNLFS